MVVGQMTHNHGHFAHYSQKPFNSNGHHHFLVLTRSFDIIPPYTHRDMSIPLINTEILFPEIYRS